MGSEGSGRCERAPFARIFASRWPAGDGSLRVHGKPDADHGGPSESNFLRPHCGESVMCVFECLDRGVTSG